MPSAFPGGRRPRLALGGGAGRRGPSAAVASFPGESFPAGLASRGRCVPSQRADPPAAGPRRARAARPAASPTLRGARAAGPPPLGRAGRGGGERRGRPPAEHPPLPLGLPPRPPRPRTARSPVVALPALLAQQQVPKPVPRGQRGHLAVQLRHPARKRRTPAAAPLRRGNRPPTHQNRGGGGGSPARQEGPGAGSGAEGSGSSPRRVRGPRAQRRPARGGRAISRRWRGMAAPARAPGREWRLTDRGLKVPPRAAGRPGRPALGGGRRR